MIHPEPTRVKTVNPEPGAMISGRPWPARIRHHQSFAILAGTTAALSLVVARLHNDDQVLVYAYFAIVGSLLAAIDAATIRLPDWLTLPSYPAILALEILNAVWSDDGEGVVRAVEATSVVLAASLVLCLCTDIGVGDLKYAGLIALVLGVRGWTVVLEGFAITWALAFLWAALLICGGRRTGRMPLGPFMTAGALLALVQL